MFRRFISHHKRAEGHIEAALQSLDLAADSAERAQEANVAAQATHMAAIDYHTELLQQADSRASRISKLLTKIHA